MKIYKEQISKLVSSVLHSVTQEEIMALLEYPAKPEMGDVSLPCFRLSKLLRKLPQQIADELRMSLHEEAIERMESVGVSGAIHHKPVSCRLGAGL
ncbi:Arginine--tRNA ligase [compost metagenome]